MKKLLVSMTIILIGLNILDIITTYLLIDHYKVCYEAIPWMESIFKITQNSSILTLPIKRTLLSFVLIGVIERNFSLKDSIIMYSCLLLVICFYAYGMSDRNVPLLIAVLTS